MSSPLRIAIVLVNWNGKLDTVACLNSLLNLTDDDFAIIVCDNDSCDGSLRAIEDWAAVHLQSRSFCQRRVTSSDVLEDFLTLLPTGGNLGFAAANNIGIRLALNNPSIEAIWVLNTDTEVEPDSLVHLRHRMADPSNVGICGSTLMYHQDRGKVQAVGVRFNLALGRGEQIGWGMTPRALPSQEVVEARMTYIPGASMLVSRSFIETIGLMSEDYFLYCEELDWVLRNKGRFKLGWAPGSIVYHKEGGSIGTKNKGRASNLAVYYQNLNLLRIARKYRPWYLPLLLLRMAGLAARFSIGRDWAGAAIVWRATRAFFDVSRPQLPAP